MRQLNTFDQWSLGFMTFALFLGAGNLIFPPSAGLAAGFSVWTASAGFLLTAVGLPLLTLVALARVGGRLDQLTAPLGRTVGLLVATCVYLSIGPLFATPRTAVVSYEMGLVPFFGSQPWLLLAYSLFYFLIVVLVARDPGHLVAWIGKVLTPVLLLGLVVLGAAAVLQPWGEVVAPRGSYVSNAGIAGFLAGYLTMDTLGALVFGIVIVTAIRDRGVTDSTRISRYTARAGMIAALGLSLVYLSLFHLGAYSGSMVEADASGAHILAAYVRHVFGDGGAALLALIIGLACMTTAIGLTVACAEFFSAWLRLPYRSLVYAFGGFSLLVANLGLSQLLRVSVPVLTALYPVTIVLVLLSLLMPLWRSPRQVFLPVVLVTLGFGLLDGLVAAGLYASDGVLLAYLPLADQQMAWVGPATATLIVAFAIDRIRFSFRKSA